MNSDIDIALKLSKQIERGVPVTGAPPELGFNEAEQEIIDLINQAHRKILALDLRANKGELASYVHGMQLFVLKHACQRLGFKGLSRWFWKDD